MVDRVEVVGDCDLERLVNPVNADMIVNGLAIERDVGNGTLLSGVIAFGLRCADLQLFGSDADQEMFFSRAATLGLVLISSVPKPWTVAPSVSCTIMRSARPLENSSHR